MRGLDQLNDVLDLVRNADKYQAKVKELKDLDAAIKASAESVADLSRAKELKATAERVLNQAKIDAEAFMKAKEVEIAKRQDILTAGLAELQKQQSEAGNVEYRGKQALASALAKEQELVKREKEIAAQSAKLAAQAASLSAKEQELNERLTKLRSVMQ
jgi:hypothetical protein